MSQNKKCSITGSNGYVGSCLKGALERAGWEVVELRRSTGFELGSPVNPALFSGVETLIHCAYDFKPVRWEDMERVNVSGSISLIETALAAGVKRVVFISSISAYDNCRSLYGRAKLAVEKFVLGKGGAVIRPGLVYGNSPGGMVGSLSQVVERSKVVPVVGASQKMFLCHEEDLAALVLKLADPAIPAPKDPVIAADSRPWKFSDILKNLAQRKNRAPFFLPLPWQLVWCGIKSAEIAGIRLGFRSDSLISLAYPNPNPRFDTEGVAFRPFV